MARMNFRSFLVVAVAAVLAGFPVSSSALTRWSTIHYVPDADFLEGWKYVGEYTGYFSGNETQGTSFRNSGFANLGLSEWADLQAGYAGGLTFGMKVKILSEGDGAHPSVAIGATNILHNKEAFFYDTAQGIWKNEYFLAFGKSINPIRLRFHFGVSTMPEVKAEQLDWFFAFEKYLGGNAYLSLETFYRDRKFHPSLFGTLRFFDQRLEFSGGAVDILGMFWGQNNKYAVSFSSPRVPGLVLPGVWFGFRYLGKFQLPGGAFGGFGSLEEQQSYQNGVIKILKHDVDSLKEAITDYDERITSFGKSFNRIADSAFETSNLIRVRNVAIEQLTIINTLYGREDFDPEKVAQAKKTILDYGNAMVGVLQDIVLDNKLERKIHVQAMTMLGELATQKAADAVLDLMGQTMDPDVKIEGIIAIGKVKDRRAVYLLDQLAGDPNSAIAFAATEVIQKLEKRAPLKRDLLGSGPAVKNIPKAIPDKRIEEENWDKFMTADSGKSRAPVDKPSSPAATPKKKTVESTSGAPHDNGSEANAEGEPTGEKTAEELANQNGTTEGGTITKNKKNDESAAKTEDEPAGEKTAEELANQNVVSEQENTTPAVKQVPAAKDTGKKKKNEKKDKKKPKEAEKKPVDQKSAQPKTW